MQLYIYPIIALIAVGGIWSFYKYQDKLIFDPDPIPDNYQYSFSNFEELTIKTNDSSINALWFKTKNSKGVIFYCHGNSGSLNTWGELGEEVLKTGYDFFIFDYRGYGKSKGALNESGIHKDVKALYTYIKERYPENKIILYGRSLGTGFATKLASENNPKSLILETPYYSFQSLAKSYFPYLPISLILKYTIRTDQWLPKVKCPVLILHGTDDEVIPYSNSIQLKDKLKAHDEYITIEHATHNNIPLFPEYADHLQKYLE